MSFRFEENSRKIVIFFTDDIILDEQKIASLSSSLMDLCRQAGQTGKRLELNFRGVRFMSSGMLAKLIWINKNCGAANVDLSFCEINPAIMEIVKMMKLHKVFKIRRSDGDDDGPDLLGSRVPKPSKPSGDSGHAQSNE